jgi:hypothetical protein
MVWAAVVSLCLCFSVRAIQFHDYSLKELTEHALNLLSPFASVHYADELWGSEMVSDNSYLLDDLT